MIIVRHPRVASISRQVPEDKLDNWVAAGWIPDGSTSDAPSQPSRGRKARTPRNKAATPENKEGDSE